MLQGLSVFPLTFVEFIRLNVIQLTICLTSGSTGRFPRSGNVSSMPGQEGVKSCHSPMTRSLDSLSYFLKAVIDQKPWDYDPSCDPIPWREVTLPPTMRIGVLRDDGNSSLIGSNVRRCSSVSRLFKSVGTCALGAVSSRTYDCSIQPSIPAESPQTGVSVTPRGWRENGNVELHVWRKE